MAARPPPGGTLAPCFLVPEPPETPTSVSVNAYLSFPLCSFGGELRRVKMLYCVGTVQRCTPSEAFQISSVCTA